MHGVGPYSVKPTSLSSSYAPMPGHADYEKMMQELRRIFDEHQQDGMVRFEYDTVDRVQLNTVFVQSDMD